MKFLYRLFDFMTLRLVRASRTHGTSFGPPSGTLDDDAGVPMLDDSDQPIFV